MFKTVRRLECGLLIREVIKAIKTEFRNKSYVGDLCAAVERSEGGIEEEFSALYGDVLCLYMEDADGELDRHRQGACVVMAFIKRLDIRSGECENHREQIALMAGFKFMGAILCAEAESKGDLKDKLFAKYLAEKGGFKFPDPICDRDRKYIDTLILGLRKTFTGLRGVYEKVMVPENEAESFDMRGVFMVPLIANVLFHIESHTRKQKDSGIIVNS